MSKVSAKEKEKNSLLSGLERAGGLSSFGSLEEQFSKDGLELSPVRERTIASLSPNPKNAFKPLPEDEYKRLMKDIKERGILVPLVALKNGMLLSGHNRLNIARELGLNKVPVMFLETDLSDREEAEFVIKDNLFRRQLTLEEKLENYKKLYPDFEQRLLTETRGRKPTKPTKKAGSREIISGGDYLEEQPNLARDIAQKTGQNIKSVQKVLTKARKELTPPAKVKATKSKKDFKSVIRMEIRDKEREKKQLLAKVSKLEKEIERLQLKLNK